MDSHAQTPELADPARVAAVRQTGLLDTPPEPTFDRLTRLASRLLRAPVAAFSLLDADRQFLKSTVGLPPPFAAGVPVPLDRSVCRHALGGLLAIEDVRTDATFRHHPAFAALGLTAYLGVPLALATGHVVGTLCVGDTAARRWTPDDVDVLHDLAESLVDAVERRVQARRLEAERRLSDVQAQVLAALGRSLPLDEVLVPLAGVFAAHVAGAGTLVALHQGATFAVPLAVDVPPAFLTDVTAATPHVAVFDEARTRRTCVVAGLPGPGDAGAVTTVWCQPVVDAAGDVVAFLAVCVRGRLHPTDDEQRLLEGGAALVAHVLDASATLRRSETRFRSIFEQAPFSLQLLSPDGRTLLVNPAWKRLWGIRDEVVERYILTEYNVLEDPQLVAKGITPYLRRGVAGEVTRVPEIEYAPEELGLGGRVRWVGAVVFPLRDVVGEVTEVVLLHEDVTDRRVAELDRERLLAQLTTERARLEAIVRQLPAAVVVAEAPGGRFLLHNAQFEALVGSGPAGGGDRGFGALAEARASGASPGWPLTRALTTGEVVRNEEFTFVQADGRQCWLDVSASPIRDADGRIVAAVLVCADVTERRRDAREQRFLAQATALLNASMEADQLVERLARSTVPELADGCLVDLVEGARIHRLVTAHADPAKLETMREIQQFHAPAPDSPHPSSRVIRTGRSELHAHVDREFVRTGTVNDRHAQLIHELGLRALLVVPIIARGRVLGALSLVVTSDRAPFDDRDRVLAEELARRAAIAIEHARLYREARHAVRQRDEFISIASHELKTPLTSLKLQAQLASRRLEQSPEGPVDVRQHRRFVDTAHRQLDRLVALVEDMLDVSRIETGKLSMALRPVDLSALVTDVLGRLADTFADARIPLSVDVAPDLTLSCDPFRMEQVVTNLLTNAIRYGNHAPVSVVLRADDRRASLRVTDQGVGIAPEDQQRIFERFERVGADSGVSGLGVGLYISREIIAAHGGTIRLESTPGVGSTFTVELPLGGTPAAR